MIKLSITWLSKHLNAKWIWLAYIQLNILENEVRQIYFSKISTYEEQTMQSSK
jgi:hypothetical protein